MDAKHTQGPWTESDWCATGPTAAANHAAIDAVEKMVKDGITEVFTRPVVQACGVGKTVVCTVYGMSAEEAQENARLIAAAPELLGALEHQHRAMDRLLARVIELDPAFRPTSWAGWTAVVQARAAIAKATGSAA